MGDEQKEHTVDDQRTQTFRNWIAIIAGTLTIISTIYFWVLRNEITLVVLSIAALMIVIICWSQIKLAYKVLSILVIISLLLLYFFYPQPSPQPKPSPLKKVVQTKLNRLSKAKKQEELAAEIRAMFNDKTVVNIYYNYLNARKIKPIDQYLEDLNVISLDDSIMIMDDSISNNPDFNNELNIRHYE